MISIYLTFFLLIYLVSQSTVLVKANGDYTMNNKKKILTTLAVGGLAISAPMAAFAFAGDNERNYANFTSPLAELTDEEKLSFMQEKIDLKKEHVEDLIQELDDAGVDTSGFDSMVDDYVELSAFLATVDVDETTRGELREAFFDLKPDREGMKELRETLRETFDEGELEEIKEGFKAEMDELRESYGLPEREGHDRKGPRGFRGF